MTGAWRRLAAVAVMVAACSPTTEPSTSAAPSPVVSTEPSASAEVSPASDVCTIQDPPDPADDPPRSGEAPTTNMGGGRYALCLLGPPGERLEDTAYCTWTPDRIAVEEVTGLPTLGGAGMYDAFLDLRAGTIQIGLTTVDGSIITYSQTDVPGAIRDDGSDGLLAFDAPLADGSPTPPPGTPPRQTGTVRWQCAGPPPA